tara:strand:- start:2890 stop:4071 length:1182 start_codon:yes stop_codon:yes gene_type:complete
MLAKKTLHKLFVCLSVFMLATGRFYDDRLSIGDFNFSIFFSSLYLIALICLVLTIKEINITPLKFLQYFFISLVIAFNLFYWGVNDFTDYGFTKFLNFILITAPLIFIYSEKMENADLSLFIYLLFSVSFLLLSLSFLNFSSLSLERGGVLGGGPIVLSRWLCLGALLSFFFQPLKKYRLFLFPLFVLAALFTGSRGPLLALMLTFLLFIVFNFRKIFFKAIAILSIVIVLIFSSGIIKYFQDFSTVVRIFNNFNNSSGRTAIYEVAVNDFLNQPLGFGLGNWHCNSLNQSYLSTYKFQYPHNIFLEIFLELGVFVGIVFVFFLIFTFVNSLKYIKCNNKDEISILFFYMFVYLFLNAQVSGDLNDSRLLFVVIAVLITLNNKYKSSQRLLNE